MNSSERAAKLQLVKHEDESDRIWREEQQLRASRKYADWRWQPIGTELQCRNQAGVAS